MSRKELHVLISVCVHDGNEAIRLDRETSMTQLPDLSREQLERLCESLTADLMLSVDDDITAHVSTLDFVAKVTRGADTIEDSRQKKEDN